MYCHLGCHISQCSSYTTCVRNTMVFQSHVQKCFVKHFNLFVWTRMFCVKTAKTSLKTSRIYSTIRGNTLPHMPFPAQCGCRGQIQQCHDQYILCCWYSWFLCFGLCLCFFWEHTVEWKRGCTHTIIFVKPEHNVNPSSLRGWIGANNWTNSKQHKKGLRTTARVRILFFNTREI